MDDIYGAWMYDTLPRSEAIADKLWVTRSKFRSILYEYNSRDDFSSSMKRSKEIRLPRPFQVSSICLFLNLKLFPLVNLFL